MTDQATADRIARLRATGSRAACADALDRMTASSLARMAPDLGFVAHDGDMPIELAQRVLNVLYPPTAEGDESEIPRPAVDAIVVILDRYTAGEAETVAYEILRDVLPHLTPAQTDRDADRTIVFPHAGFKRHAEVAIERADKESAQRRRVAEILHLDGHRRGIERVGDILDLGDDNFVVEVVNALGKRDRIMFCVVLDGEQTPFLYETRDMALLAYVGRSHTGMSLDALVRGAARMLTAAQEG